MAEFVPYGKLDATAIQCIHASAQKHQVPESLLHAFIKKEDGTMGQCVRNTNGTYDCGLAQINTVWAKEFAQYNVSYQHVASDACLNVDAQGYIVRKMYNLKQDWFKTIVSYNIGPNNWTPNRYAIGHKYATDVVKYWWHFEKYRNTGIPPGPVLSAAATRTNTAPSAIQTNFNMPSGSQFLGKAASNKVATPKPPKKANERSHPKAPFIFSVESDQDSESSDMASN